MAFLCPLNFRHVYLIPHLPDKLRFFGYNLDRLPHLLLQVIRLHLLFYTGWRIVALFVRSLLPAWGIALPRFLVVREILNFLCAGFIPSQRLHCLKMVSKPSDKPLIVELSEIV